MTLMQHSTLKYTYHKMLVELIKLQLTNSNYASILWLICDMNSIIISWYHQLHSDDSSPYKCHPMLITRTMILWKLFNDVAHHNASMMIAFCVMLSCTSVMQHWRTLYTMIGIIFMEILTFQNDIVVWSNIGHIFGK